MRSGGGVLFDKEIEAATSTSNLYFMIILVKRKWWPFSFVSITNLHFLYDKQLKKKVFYFYFLLSTIYNLHIDLWDLRFQYSGLKSPKSIKYWWLIKDLLKFTPKCNKTFNFLFLGFRRKEDIGLVWLLITLMWVIKKLPLIRSKKKKKSFL